MECCKNSELRRTRFSLEEETKPILQGKIVIVTGGAKGIGRYAAHTLAQAGGTVIIVDVDVERLRKTLGELRDLKFEAWALAADVRHEDEVRRMVHQVVDRYGRIDVLVNDAGIVPHFNWGIPRWPRVRFMSKDFWDSVIQTNLGGTFLCTKYVVPFMEARRSGNIVNLWGGGKAENHGAAAYVVSRTPSALSRASSPKRNANGMSASWPSAPSKPSPRRMRRKRRESACPAPSAWAMVLYWRRKPAWS